MNFLAISNILALTLAALFLLAGAAQIIGPHVLPAHYRRWGFAPDFSFVAGVAELFAALFLAVPQTRIWGGSLAAMILFTTVVWLLNRGKYVYAIPAIAVMVALAPALAGSVL